MATWLSGISKQHRTIRRNAFIWCGLYIAALLVMVLRLAWLQLAEGPRFRHIADEYHLRDSALPAMRGRLLDRNLAVLALDDQRLSLFADPKLVQYPEFVARQLAPVLGLSEAQVYAGLTYRPESVWVKRGIDLAAARELRRHLMPGLEVVDDPPAYRVGINTGAATDPLASAALLAATLDQPAETINTQLGVKAPEEHTGHTASAPAPGTRWLPEPVSQREWQALATRGIPGLISEPARPSCSLRAYPRTYSDATGRLMAKELAPYLAMTQEAAERRVVPQPRFAWLKRGLPEDTYDAVMRLQGTMFVVEPGKVLAEETDEKKTTPEERMADAVTRLYDMLNSRKPDKKGHLPPEQISREEIRRRLSPGAAPGPLGVKLVKGNPDILITRRLFAQPIPGVMYGLPGVSTQHEPRRYYPFDSLAAATLGYVGYVGRHKQGVFGLELAEERTLRGVDGHETREIDGRRFTIPERSTRVEPVNGRDVILTLDLDIQQAADEELRKSVEACGAVSGQCIVMDPHTGEILAMATAPAWNANEPGKAKALVNPAISHYYEPGSTFKTLTTMAAMEEGIAHDGQTITNCTGAMPVGRRTIGEAHNAHGPVDLGRLLEQSCNIGAATLALRLGPDRFLTWCEKLGFGHRTDIGLGAESSGSLNRSAAKANITLANMGFGQGLAVTPLQMAVLYSAVANGGEWVQPHLVKARVQRDGTLRKVTVPRRRVCSEETARLLRGYLERVVTKGTAKSAAIKDENGQVLYRMAGKTGTAQKAIPGIGYASGKVIGSFVGFTPVEDPKLTIITVIDEPQTSHYGGVVAAPVVREVGRRALQYMHVPPSVTVSAAPQEP